MLLDEVRADLAPVPADDLLPPQRRGRGVTATAIENVALLAPRTAVAQMRLADGRAVIVPLVKDGRWRRAEARDAISASASSASAPFEVSMSNPLPVMHGRAERAIEVDMSNELRVIDDAVVAKWQFALEPGSLAGPRMVEHLAQAGFDEMPAPLGYVTWNDCLIVSYTGFLPDAHDGWDWMLDDVLRMLSGESAAPEWPARLGALIGRLHAAAVRPTSEFPAPVGRANLTPLADHYRHLLAADLDPELREALTPWSDRLDDALAIVASASDAQVIPLHGDLHPGQFLRWREGTYVGDFDGNPLLPAVERGLPGPTAHDVAGLLRGFDHVAIAAARRLADAKDLPTGRAWAQQARADALAAYLDVEGVPSLDVPLLEALETLSPLHEAVYAAEYLPRWRYVPLAVLRGGP